MYKEYSKVLNQLYTDNPKKVGLELSDWEYPLFGQYYDEKIALRAINVNNITNKIPQDATNLEAIISNQQKNLFLFFALYSVIYYVSYQSKNAQ